MRLILTAKERDKLINEVMQNYPEASSYSLVCREFDYKTCEFEFFEVEEVKTHIVTLPKLRKGLDKMLKEMLEGKLPGISKHVFSNVLDAGNWDALAADTLVQYSIFGKEVYA